MSYYLKWRKLVSHSSLDEGRRSRRYSVSKSGFLVSSNMAPVPVKVVDLSATGAHIIADREFSLPANCALQLSAEQLQYSVRIIWQNAAEAGVAFFGEPEFCDGIDQI